MEKSGVVSQYKRWYNLFPVKYYEKAIEKELKILSEKLNATLGSSEKMELEILKWNVESLNLINSIRANLLGITNILNLSTKLNVITNGQTKRIKKRLKFKNKNLSRYINNIKELTGIEINSPEDIQIVDEHLQYRIDKYNSMIRKQQADAPDKKVYLMDIVISILNYLNEPVNVHLTVLEFIDFRNSAIEKSNKERSKVNG